MPGSYEDINYALRPAKSVERKMLCEVFNRLSEFGSVGSYRYVGFPSTYFSDFIVFHKSLGIHNMVGIEVDSHNKERFDFNVPFRCITMHYGKSTEVLPTLSWDAKTIIWLDYDTRLDADILADVRYFCASAVAGSVIIVTVDARPGDGDPDTRLADLNVRVGGDKVPLDVVPKQLAKWGTAEVYRRILNNEIKQTLIERNGLRAEDAHLDYKQLFYFCYADSPSATMLTAGGLLFEKGQRNLVAKCGFRDFPFVRSGGKPYFIEVPCLTFREIRHLDTQLPRCKGERLHAHRVPVEDLKRYERIYRYFPTFAEAEM